MSRPAYLAVLLVHLLAFPTALRADPELRWRWRAQEQLFAECTSLKVEKARVGGQLVNSVEELRLVTQLKVVRVLPNGGAELRVYISRAEERSQGRAPGFIKKLEGAILQVAVDDKAVVTQMDGLQDTVKELVSNENDPRYKATLEAFDKLVRYWLVNILTPLPNRAVRQGESWQHTQERVGNAYYGQTTTFTVAGQEQRPGGKCTKIQAKADVRLIAFKNDDFSAPTDVSFDHKDITATLLFDPQRGRIVESKTHGRLAISAKRVAFGSPVDVSNEWTWVDTLQITDDDPLTRKEPSSEAVVLQLVAHQQPREIVNSLGMKLVQLPAGTFWMGAPDSKQRSPYEERHQVTLSKPFYMGAHEVTIGQFRQFVQATGYRPAVEQTGLGSYGWNQTGKRLEMKSNFDWQRTGWELTDSHPVTRMTWYDAKAFCAWLSAKENKHYRLPTEAEWEYGCRAGATTPYSSGDDPEDLVKHANIADTAAKENFPQWPTLRGSDGHAFSAPVGSFRPNAFGLYDMHGNAQEWCEDWLWYYPKEAVRDPRGAPLGLQRVLRGGGWCDFPQQCTAFMRMGTVPRDGNISSGFRVVLTDEPRPSAVEHEVTQRGRRVLARTLTCPNPVPPQARPLQLAQAAATVIHEENGVLRVHRDGDVSVWPTRDALYVEDAVAYYTAQLAGEKKEPVYYLLRAAAWKEKGNPDAALKDLDAAVALVPENPLVVSGRATELVLRKQYARAIADYHTIVKAAPNMALMQQALAWLLATCPEQGCRDGKKAVEHAEQALRQYSSRDGYLLDTLAAALAEAGDFEQAVRRETEALADPFFARQLGEQARARLELYKSGTPYRDASGAVAPGAH